MSPTVMGADSTGTWVTAVEVLLLGGLQASPGTAVGVLGASWLLQPVRGVTHRRRWRQPGDFPSTRRLDKPFN